MFVCLFLSVFMPILVQLNFFELTDPLKIAMYPWLEIENCNDARMYILEVRSLGYWPVFNHCVSSQKTPFSCCFAAAF